ncbi:MAG: hypothetical protein OEU46_09800 [Alphaproteobacteria bacterium]|nr:hypothetical protein [Alphaproteobacteria bacterium]
MKYSTKFLSLFLTPLLFGAFFLGITGRRGEKAARRHPAFAGKMGRQGQLQEQIRRVQGQDGRQVEPVVPQYHPQSMLELPGQRAAPHDLSGQEQQGVQAQGL